LLRVYIFVVLRKPLNGPHLDVVAEMALFLCIKFDYIFL